ncbi:rhotekin-2-like isoform X1 [Anneissia japonica]|uniref:rhotekin-2-like isoform X1 n=1 Tax=Anneissia japonica TaxID=1529436 RepID=UPI001425684A|nr:rhotekin-2-like isoform X1 [Anneissia japonica]
MSDYSSTQHIIEDLDLFYFRQLAISLQDYDIQQKIDLEIKMREGTAKLLAACKRETQSLEAAKSLLMSNARVMAYMSELQKRKTAECMERASGNSMSSEEILIPCKAKVAVSDLRIPIVWKEEDHIMNKGDHNRYAVFCLLKIGTEIYDTEMVTNVDRQSTDINFDDVIIFENISHEFAFHLEVYSYNLHNDLTIASTPQKIRRKLNSFSNSLGKSAGKKTQAAMMTTSITVDDAVTQGPRFSLVAKAKLSLKDIYNGIKIHDLQVEQDVTCPHRLRIYGHFCCRLVAQPTCMMEEMVSGYLNFQEIVGTKTQWTRKWCVLREGKLKCWNKPEDVGSVIPVTSIRIQRDTVVSSTDQAVRKRLNTFLMTCKNGSFKVKYIIATESNRAFSKWIQAFEQHFLDTGCWKEACQSKMLVKSPKPKRIAPASPPTRKASIYEDLSITTPDKNENIDDVDGVFDDSPADNLRSKVKLQTNTEESTSPRMLGRETKV